jgi:hypothetical protein
METRDNEMSQDSIQANEDKLNKVKCQAFGHFRKKKRACLKDKINELSTHRSSTLKIYGKEYINERWVTNLEVTWQSIRKMIHLQIPQRLNRWDKLLLSATECE